MGRTPIGRATVVGRLPLADLESYTMERFGSGAGIIEEAVSTATVACIRSRTR